MPRTDFRMPCVLAMLPVWGLVGERLARIQTSEACRTNVTISKGAKVNFQVLDKEGFRL